MQYGSCAILNKFKNRQYNVIYVNTHYLYKSLHIQRTEFKWPHGGRLVSLCVFKALPVHS